MLEQINTLLSIILPYIYSIASGVYLFWWMYGTLRSRLKDQCIYRCDDNIVLAIRVYRYSMLWVDKIKMFVIPLDTISSSDDVLNVEVTLLTRIITYDRIFDKVSTVTTSSLSFDEQLYLLQMCKKELEKETEDNDNY